MNDLKNKSSDKKQGITKVPDSAQIVAPEFGR